MSDPEYQSRLKGTKRNDVCPCGSGRKYKKCHLPEDEAQEHADAQARAAQLQAASESATDPETHPAKKKAAPPIPGAPRQKQRAGATRQGQDPRPNNLPRRKAV